MELLLNKTKAETVKKFVNLNKYLFQLSCLV